MPKVIYEMGGVSADGYIPARAKAARPSWGYRGQRCSRASRGR
jgi:hypothetical protein